MNGSLISIFDDSPRGRGDNDWGFNEPSNKGGCAAVKTSDGTWFAEDCGVRNNFVCSTPVKVNICDDEWIYFPSTGFCYRVFYHSDWTTAENSCLERGAHLVSIHSKEENDFLQDISQCGFSSSEGNSKETLIGLFTTTNDNTMWKWTDGSSLDYASWFPSEPDNAGVEKCTTIYADTISQVSAGLWNNVRCDLEFRNYICKKLPSQLNIM